MTIVSNLRWAREIRSAATAAVIGVALLVAAPAASATNYVVNTTQDLLSDNNCAPAAGGCTIRDALSVATSADTVTLPAGIYNLNSQFGELDMAGDNLSGAGARSTIIDGGLATRVIQASDETTPSGEAASQISGVTIRRGRALGTANTNIGGGIQVSGTLGLVNSAVIGNSAQTSGGGIGLGSGSRLVMVGSTVAGNSSSGGSGGGIYSANEGTILAITNSTISDNLAPTGSGGGLFGGGGSHFQLINTTVAGNQATNGGGISAGAPVFANAILAGNAPSSCATTGVTTSNNTVVDDNSCGLSGTGDVQNTNPGLGALANNGGQTDTRAIGPSSIAINHGGASCQATDQRGVPRPSGACDSGAFEYVAPRLTVVTSVINNDGSTQTASDFNVHVRAGSADVSGSPQHGTTTGTTYSLAPGTYSVAEDPDTTYTASFSGACSATGVLTLAESQVATCTITNNDKQPKLHKNVNLEPERGTVRIKRPGSKKFKLLKEGEQVPVGTIVDTRHGRVTLIAAASKTKTATAQFFDGLFKIGQTKGKKPTTVLTLTEKLTGCKAKGKASAAKKKVKKRRLWGDGHGHFQTKAKHSAATVVGTKWLVEDRCTSTLTKVARGRVKVRDFEKHKTVFVKKGHRYIARAK